MAREWWSELPGRTRARLLLFPVGYIIVGIYLAVEGAGLAAVLAFIAAAGWPVVLGLHASSRRATKLPPKSN